MGDARSLHGLNLEAGSQVSSKEPAFWDTRIWRIWAVVSGSGGSPPGKGPLASLSTSSVFPAKSEKSTITSARSASDTKRRSGKVMGTG